MGGRVGCEHGGREKGLRVELREAVGLDLYGVFNLDLDLELELELDSRWFGFGFSLLLQACFLTALSIHIPSLPTGKTVKVK